MRRREEDRISAEREAMTRLGVGIRCGLLCVSLLVGGAGLLAAATSPDDPLPRRTYLGVQVTPLAMEKAAQLHLTEATGLQVQSVVPGSPAEDAGLRAGDILLKADGAPISTPVELSTRTAHQKQGTKIIL